MVYLDLSLDSADGEKSDPSQRTGIAYEQDRAGLLLGVADAPLKSFLSSDLYCTNQNSQINNDNIKDVDNVRYSTNFVRDR